MEAADIYQETLDYLYRFVDFSLTRGLQIRPDQFDLDRMRDFMAFLGHPEEAYPIIHVAGTKGKGSVASFCASALRAAGYRVGLYTSPHLEDYNERIQVNGEPIPHAALIDLVNEIRPYLDQGTRLTTFEITTALAFLYFARQGATAVVAEVGLGGRLDATNVITPVVSVITSLSLDHTSVLGDSLAAIAREKAGIIKPGVPVVLAPQKEEPRQVVTRIARELGSPLIQVGDDLRFSPLVHSMEKQSLLVWKAHEEPLAQAFLVYGDSEGWDPKRLEIPLLADYQAENAAVAYAVLQVASQRGLPANEESIQAGFSQVSWPGRFEILRQDPPVVVDCAHNRDSAARLRQALEAYFPEWPVVMIFGASEDKDIAGILDELLPRVEQVIATRSFHPRALEAEKLAELVQLAGKNATIIPEVPDALEYSIQLAGGRALILATGSIFIAAAVRQTWRERAQST
jgi:dihydrofolate synthase/folylpolyglutamate synthase